MILISIKDYLTFKLTKIWMNYKNAISSKKFHVLCTKKKQKLREKKKVLMKRHNLDYK